MLSVSIEDVRQASERIAPYISTTPVLSSSLINELAGCRIDFKCENLQKCGAFKARGAHNAVLQLSDEQRSKGVTTHSSGNHAAALSLAASRLGCKAYVVMPENTSAVKISAVKSYGGEITFCEPTMAAREQTVLKITESNGATLVPPYDSAHIIAGQGTAALEFLQQVEGTLDHLITPVGGGGLLGGSAVAARAMQPSITISGAEPYGADDAFQSFQSGEWQPQLAPDTIADGLRSSTGKLNFQIISDLVDDIILLNDEDIIDAMKIIWTRMKLIVEPSSAIALAAVLKNKTRFSGKHVGIIISGGNVDLSALPW